MRPLVDKNQHQQNASLQPRRPQIVIGDQDKELAPIDTCTTVAPSVAGAGANFAPSSNAYENIAPSAGAGANVSSTSGANGQETKPNSANVIHCNFVLKRTNDPVHQI